jgi:CPA2 family monovalent cation:H+ antiporter-2
MKVALLLLFTFIVGDRVIPWLFGRIALTRSRELFTLSVLVVALGIAVGSAKVFGVSMALGAFLAGMVVGRSEFSARAGSDALPMRDAFAVLFFVSVGMLLDPWHITEAPGSVLLVTAIIMIGKPLIAMLVVIITRYPLHTAVTVAVALAQIGEFSFILAARAEYFGLFSRAVSNTLITAAILSITLNPLYYRVAQFLSRAYTTRRRRRLDEYGQSLDESGSDSSEEDQYDHRAIVIGSGPVGQIITRILRDNRIEPVVVELNIRRVRQLRKEGVSVVYGDAADELVMQAAGIEKAVSLMISPGGMNGVERVIRLARRLNPQIRVFARTEFLSNASELLRAGALRVFSDEGEVALAFGEELLRELGASADQIDRERDRVHEELIAMQIDDDSDGVSDGKMPAGGDGAGGAV